MSEQPELLPQIARLLLDTNFESSLHEDICAEAGLNLEGAEAALGKDAPVWRRDPEFRGNVLLAYEYRCAFCGYDGALEGTMVGLDAARARHPSEQPRIDLLPADRVRAAPPVVPHPRTGREAITMAQVPASRDPDRSAVACTSG